MKKAIILITVILISSIALFTYLTGAGNSEEIVLTNLVVGEPAPDFSVVEYNGAIDDRPTTKVKDLEGALNYVVEAMDALLNGGEVAVRTNTPYGCTVKY